jgi:hypothetical protein
MAKHEQHFVKIPKDLSLIRQKFFLGLTKRQLICFGIGAAIGFPAFYIFNSMLGLQAGCFALGIGAGPAIFCGFFKKNGMHLEQAVKLMIAFLRKPKERTYQSENSFEIISRQLEYNRLKRMLRDANPDTRKRR